MLAKMIAPIILLTSFIFPATGNLFDSLTEQPCDFVVIGSFSFSTFVDQGKSSFIFESVKQFIQRASDLNKFELVLSSTSCLAMILETDDDNEVSTLIDFLSDLSFVGSKYFLLQSTSEFDEDLFSNKTINFDVIISEHDGRLEGNDIKSWCSVLGEVPLKLISGACPPALKNPYGKEFDVCYEDPPPLSYIMTANGLDGSDFEVLKILKQQLNFSSVEKLIDIANEIESVSSKQCDIIIGQRVVNFFGLWLVSFLPWMYPRYWYLRSGKPQEIASFETLILPMEPSLWAFTAGFTILVFVSLHVILQLWSNLTGKKIPDGHLFQGI